jgi:hypothetical protein
MFIIHKEQNVQLVWYYEKNLHEIKIYFLKLAVIIHVQKVSLYTNFKGQRNNLKWLMFIL